MAELGWHFLRDENGKPAYRDGIGTPAVGDVRTHDGPLAMCQRGLHFSRRPIDALVYAPGPWMCRVRVDGEMIYENDKGIARRREILWIADVTPVLRVFARWCAQSVLHLWSPPAPEIVVRWIETGDDSLRAAVWDAAGDAVWDAAWDAARAAARAAAWAAARDAQNKVLNDALKIALAGPKT